MSGEDKPVERHFHEALADLKNLMIQMATEVENAIAKSIESLVRRDSHLAGEVIDSDDVVNRLEMQIEDECLKLLALHQPVAVDLRFLTSAIKLASDLERMGDHAVNIAQRALLINENKPLKKLLSIPRMADIAKAMARDSIDSFVKGLSDKARSVCVRDDEVDGLDNQLFRELLTYMMEDPATITTATNLLLVSKNIERIADLATNIAEEVIFINTAKTIKHHAEMTDVHTRS
jgi:phosphate transport system protein